MQLFAALDYWHWWVGGLLLSILEVFAPGVVFIWIGLAAFATGLIAFAFPGLDWKVQAVLFGVLCVASIVLSRRFLRRHPLATDRPALNRRGQQYVGRGYTLAEPILNGRGRLKVDDTMWKIVGPDLPAGAQVRVTGVDGVLLTVEDAAAPATPAPGAAKPA